MYNVLLCDDNAQCLEVLSLAINREQHFKVIAQAYDGKKAIASIEQHCPDIIILDIVMPEYDGVYVVNHIRKSMKEYDPLIYILSGFGTDPVVRTFNELGVDYYSMKPVSPSVVVRNLRTLIHQRDSHAFSSDACGDSERIEAVLIQETLEETIKCILLRFGLLPHRASTECVLDALVLYTNSSESNPLLTKFLYPQVAQRHNLSGISVEKNIRHAITQIQKRNTELFQEIFSYSTKGRITNGEFLSVMSDYVSKSMKGSYCLAHGEPK